jgi:hypothetical protein
MVHTANVTKEVDMGSARHPDVGSQLGIKDNCCKHLVHSQIMKDGTLHPPLFFNFGPINLQIDLKS